MSFPRPTLPLAASLLLALVACGTPKPPEGATEAKGDDPKADTPPTPPPSGSGGGYKTGHYDKEHTDIVLARAARAVKDHCGEAKDENGQAKGPWGKLTVQVKLGRNGRGKGVVVPPSHAEAPVGKCIVQAFANLHFPPWSGEDESVDWEVELVEPPPPPEPAKSGTKPPTKPPPPKK